MTLSKHKAVTTIIKITSVEEKVINNKPIVNVVDENGTRYTHWVDTRNNGWENHLKTGVTMPVFYTEKPNPNNPQYPYRNIAPDISNTNPLNKEDE